MARLGELLVAAGLLTAEQVEQALRAQVMWGGRLGTNLIELGYLDLDQLSQQLARQHKIPAALARHFDKADRELQQKLSADVAERYSAIPLLRIGPQKMVVFASIGAIDKRGLAIIAGELGITIPQLIPAIAAELRIRYHLERVYKIPRGTRFLRSRGKTIPPFPQFEIGEVELAFEDSEVENVLPTQTSELPVITQLADDDLEITTEETQPLSLQTIALMEQASQIDQLVDYSSLATLDDAGRTSAADDDLAVPTEYLGEPSGRDRRRYVRTITDEPATESERALGRIAIRRVAIASAAAGATLGEATRAIRRSTDRDKVADLVVTNLERFLPACEAAILLVVRGEVAIGWKGFCRSGGQIPEIGVPLEQHGIAHRAVARGCTVRSPSGDLSSIDQLLMASLGSEVGDLAIVPVTIADQVMCLIALVVEADTPVATAESIAAAAGAAFARLMRDASR